MDERIDADIEQNKEEWLETAARFCHDGDFKGMRACAREILAHDMDDVDGQALFAQASLYLGEEETAEVGGCFWWRERFMLCALRCARPSMC